MMLMLPPDYCWRCCWLSFFFLVLPIFIATFIVTTTMSRSGGSSPALNAFHVILVEVVNTQSRCAARSDREQSPAFIKRHG
jgi:hypothetical protein